MGDIESSPRVRMTNAVGGPLWMTNQVGRNERYKQFFVGYENGFVGVSFWRDRDETPHSIDHIELRAAPTKLRRKRELLTLRAARAQ